MAGFSVGREVTVRWTLADSDGKNRTVKSRMTVKEREGINLFSGRKKKPKLPHRGKREKRSLKGREGWRVAPYGSWQKKGRGKWDRAMRSILVEWV